MNLNRLSISFVALIAFALGCERSSPDDDGGDGDGVPLAGPATAALQAGLDEFRAHGVSGLVAELRDGGRRARVRSGVARLDAEAPPEFEGYFRMGSNTKTFVAVVALQLVGEGALSLDDTVERWLPGVVSGNGNDGKLITVRQLLQHTSGLANYTGEMPALFSADAYLAHRFDHTEPDALVALALQHAPNFAPGTKWEYSNTNYILAGMIIKRVTGRDWKAEAQARIIGPLGLEHTFDPGDEPGLPEPHARGYEQFAEGGPLVDVTLANQTWADAAGSLVSTAADLATFWQRLQEGALLRPEQMAQLRATVAAPLFDPIWPGVRYGLGIVWVPTTCGGGYWSHSGDTLGFATRNAASDDGARVAVFSLTTQRGVAAAEDFRRALEVLDRVMCANGG